MGIAVLAVLVGLVGAVCLVPAGQAYLASAQVAPLVDGLIAEIVGRDDVGRRWRLLLLSLALAVVASQIQQVSLWRAAAVTPIRRLRWRRLQETGRIVLAIAFERLLLG